ncbi:hypothetical protein AVEN_178601-1 [Araneus ventricosus]|uniref:Uncharacterized protein n=1 Tax=Araneus ventricosus TaxID=182803 RepID=A0A4Y2SAY2_ARAVE|nr:hypothetical protein AVEN_178601-1 [Araneus ventricosus]
MSSKISILVHSYVFQNFHFGRDMNGLLMKFGIENRKCWNSESFEIKLQWPDGLLTHRYEGREKKNRCLVWDPEKRIVTLKVNGEIPRVGDEENGGSKSGTYLILSNKVHQNKLWNIRE